MGCEPTLQVKKDKRFIRLKGQASKEVGPMRTWSTSEISASQKRLRVRDRTPTVLLDGKIDQWRLHRGHGTGKGSEGSDSELVSKNR